MTAEQILDVDGYLHDSSAMGQVLKQYLGKSCYPVQVGAAPAAAKRIIPAKTW